MVMQNNIQILYVDDDEDDLLIMGHLLRELNVNLVKTASAEEAIAKVCTQTFDLIILDIEMPKKNGFDLVAIIKNNPRTSNTPFIFITGKKDKDSIVSGYNTGAIEYFTKPLDQETFVAKFKVILRTHEENKNLRAQINKHTELVKKIEEQIGIITKLSKYAS